MSESERSLDPQGEARGVLQSAVAGYGPQVLSNVDLIEGICADQLSDWPREASLIVSAAEVNVAAKISEQVASVGPDTAVQLAASTLADARSLDPAACRWVVAEFARALGHQVTLSATVPQEGETALPGATTVPQGSVQPPPSFQGAGPGDQATVVPDNLLGVGQVQPPSLPPPVPQQPPAGRSPGGNRTLVAVAGVIAIVAGYFIVATVAKLPPFEKTAATTTTLFTTPTTHPPPCSAGSSGNSGAPCNSTTTTAAPTPGPSARLRALIPLGITSEASCKTNRSPNGGAEAEVDCDFPSSAAVPITGLAYLMYGDQSSLTGAYTTALSNASTQMNAGDCKNFASFDPPCETGYSTHNVNEGRILEYLDPKNNNLPTLVWTYAVGGKFILMIAETTTSFENGMVTWWAALPPPWLRTT